MVLAVGLQGLASARMTQVTIAIWQCAPAPHDIPANLTRLKEAALTARARGADLLVAPELTLTGYDVGDLAPVDEASPGRSVGEALTDVAREAGIALVVGAADQDEDGTWRNCSFVVDEVGVRLRYIKSHLFGDLDRARFSAGEVDVLVSTTVIEVGVDVPNASAMVILDADRFGVSQVHQLRGRIGRGGHPGVCLLLTATEVASALARLDAVSQTTDGFELARLDLTQRREGDVLGTAQHGSRNQLQHLSVLRDEEIIESAREDATALLTQDPELSAHPQLRETIASWLDAEQAAYLEKG